MSDDYYRGHIRGYIVVGVLLTVLAAVGMLPLGATPAHATLIGDTVTVQEYYPTLSSPYGAPVNILVPGSTGFVFGVLEVDVEASSIIITSRGGNDTSQPFNGLVFTNLNDSSGNPLTGVSVDTNIVGFPSSNVTFTSHTIAANFASTAAAGTATLGLTFSDPPAPSVPSSVPEPASLTLFGSGLLGLAGAAWRRSTHR